MKIEFSSLRIKFEPRDLWIGVFWDRGGQVGIGGCYHWIEIFVCLLPCFPISFTVDLPYELFEDE